MKRFSGAMIAVLSLAGHATEIFADHRVPPIFAACDTSEGVPIMNLQIRKNPQDSGVMAYLATLQPGTRFWSTDTLVGNQLDLGRDPICEVYEFDAKKSYHRGISEIQVCFERHEDGTYGGVLFQTTAGGVTVERRLTCSYPAQR